MPTVLHTHSLTIRPCTAQITHALLSGAPQLESLLGARVPDDWPQQDLRDALSFFTGMLDANPNACEWLLWVTILDQVPAVIGDAGFKGAPDALGTVELGYSILPPYRRRGFATEAARALMNWAILQPGVRRVTARCAPENTGSVCVLRNLGMKEQQPQEGMRRWEYTVAAGV